jgi:hypothetical protein
MKRLNEKEIRAGITAIDTEEKALQVMRDFSGNQEELAIYIDQAMGNYNTPERFFIMTSASTIWHIITSLCGDMPRITRDVISAVLDELNAEIRPLLTDIGGDDADPFTSINAIVSHSSQPEMLITFIGLMLSGAETPDSDGENLREDHLQSLFYHMLVIIETMVRAERLTGGSNAATVN